MAIAVEVLPIGPVAVASRIWRHRGRRLFTAIVKATCSIVHDGPMAVVKASPIVTEERHHRGNPVASLVRGSDFALLVPRPELVIVASAYAPPGQETKQISVRLAVQREDTVLMNKRLEVVGDRRAKPGAPPPEPLPFAKMPIMYERARGGISARDNPIGVGLATDPDGLLTLPNVNHPEKGGVNPAGLGPIPSAWPLRQKKRGSLSWTNANLSPDVDVPDDFDDAYYQTAPVDQQAPELRGGDLIALVNMHPELPMLRSYLPAARGVALAQTARGDRIPLSLRIDTVHLEPDAMRAELVFRGFAVVEERDLGDLRLAGALEQPGAPFAFPDLSTLSGLVMRADRMPSITSFESTAVIADPVDEAARDAAVRDVYAPTVASSADHPVGRTGTMVMEREPAHAVAGPNTTPLPAADEDAAPARRRGGKELEAFEEETTHDADSMKATPKYQPAPLAKPASEAGPEPRELPPGSAVPTSPRRVNVRSELYKTRKH